MVTLMVKIPVMRKLHKEYRMQADSLEEIRRGLDRMAFEYDGPKVGSRSVSEGHVINAAILTLMAMPQDQRERALEEAFAKMNALMAIDEPDPDQVRFIIEGAKGETPGEGPGAKGGLKPGEHRLDEGARLGVPQVARKARRRKAEDS